MKILSVNAGSSSLKFRMYSMPSEESIIAGTFERIGIGKSFYTIKLNDEKIKKEAKLNDHEDTVKYLIKELLDNKVIESLDEIKGVGHRIVHGGDKYSSSVLINNEVINDLKRFAPLAPLHNMANILGINAFKKAIPNAVQVAVFDTAFHQTMEKQDFLYAVPYKWYTDYSVRKYGFHGTSHKYLSNRISSILGKKNFKAITCHLGNGGSVTAIKNGKCIDTSMGFTPNTGIIMGTRCGDIDAFIIPYVMKKEAKPIADITDILNKQSGLLGISGISSDDRDIENGVELGNPRCILAKQMYIKSIVGYIAKYFVELDGVDAICFAGGIGENSSDTRRQIIEKLKVLGIQLDKKANQVRGEEALISTPDSRVACYVVPTNEELMIARDTLNFIK